MGRITNLNKTIKEQVVDPAIAKQSGLKSGIILSAQYETNSYIGGDVVLLDIVIYDDSGSSSQQISGVQLVKVPGVQASLPAVGSTAVIAFLDGDSSRPVCIGILPNKITGDYTKDHVSPRVPPKNISK